MSIFVAFALAGFVTYLLRISMIIVGQRFATSQKFEAAVALVSPAVLAAIVATAVFVRKGQLILPEFLTAVAVAAAFVAVRKTGNIGMALAVGLPIYWLGAAVGLT